MGGFAGSLARSGLTRGFPVGVGQWPWPTFTVNILGAALLGWLIAHDHARGRPSLYGRSFLAIGLCGALTTFSTLMLELLAMLEASRWGLAAAYVAASVGCGLAAVLSGSALARRRQASR